MSFHSIIGSRQLISTNLVVFQFLKRTASRTCFFIKRVQYLLFQLFMRPKTQDLHFVETISTSSNQLIVQNRKTLAYLQRSNTEKPSTVVSYFWTLRQISSCLPRMMPYAVKRVPYPLSHCSTYFSCCCRPFLHFNPDPDRGNNFRCSLKMQTTSVSFSFTAVYVNPKHTGPSASTSKASVLNAGSAMWLCRLQRWLSKSPQ